MIRIFHAADLHLDSPFQGLSAQQAALRRREQRGLLDKLCAMAEECGAQLFLLSGDLLDSSEIYAQTAQSLMAALSRLSMPVFIAPGNHDHYSPRSPYARLSLPENVHIFTQPSLSCVALPELGVRVWGAGYPDNTCPPLLRSFSLEKEEETLDVLVLHGEVAASSRYCPISEEELDRSGFDYVALGHRHSCSGLRRSGRCHYAWPGCPEGRGFDECGEKGVMLVDLGFEGCRAQFLPTATRRYEQLEVEAGEDALAALERALPGDTQHHVYRITLTGEREHAPDLAALRRALEGRFFALELIDATLPRRDVWERQAEQSLRGLFLRRLRVRYEAAESDEARRLVLMAVRAGLAALDGGEDEL